MLEPGAAHKYKSANVNSAPYASLFQEHVSTNCDGGTPLAVPVQFMRIMSQWLCVQGYVLLKYGLRVLGVSMECLKHFSDCVDLELAQEQALRDPVRKKPLTMSS